MRAKLIFFGAVILLICATTSNAQISFDHDLVALDEQHDRAVAAALEPIERRYQAALEQLLQRATLNKDLDTALKINEKLSALRHKVSPFVGQWRESEGGIVTVLADGTARHTNGATATWETKENNTTFTWNNGAKHTFSSLPTGDTVHGTLIRGSKSQPWTWTRSH